MSMHRTPTAAVVAAALGLMLLLVLAVTANSPGCEYRCEKGLDRVPREGHKPTSNGCGTSMIKISSKISFTSCCDKHDICYDTCGSVRLRARSQHSSPSHGEHPGIPILAVCAGGIGARPNADLQAGLNAQRPTRPRSFSSAGSLVLRFTLVG